eukprot:346545-Pleurochrysis_carterae.AAC.2
MAAGRAHAGHGAGDLHKARRGGRPTGQSSAMERRPGAGRGSAQAGRHGMERYGPAPLVPRARLRLRVARRP